jgi:virginiamycin B lyase
MADGLEDLLRACTVRVLGGPMPGAGFFVAPGTVLTCLHVIGDSAGLSVRWERDGAVPLSLPVTGPPLIVPGRGRPIRNLDRDYPDIAVLNVDAPAGHPCVRMDVVRPEHGDPVVVFGYPQEGGSVHLTPAGLTYRGLHGTSPVSFWDLGADAVKPGMSGAAALHLRTGVVGGIIVASKNPARADGALAVPWHEVERDLSGVLAANRAFNAADHRWNDAARPDAGRPAAAGTQSATGNAPGTDIHGGQGIQAGSHNVQYNFYAVPAPAAPQPSTTTHYEDRLAGPAQAGPPPHVSPQLSSRRRSRKGLIWGLIALAVLVFAVIGVVLSESGAVTSTGSPASSQSSGSPASSQSASALAVTPAGSAASSQSASTPTTVTRTFQAVVTSGSAAATSCQPKQQSEQAFVTTTPAATPTREGDILVYADPGGSSPIGITKGPDGAMWYANAGADYSIGRITASGAITHYRAAAGLVRPFGIAAGPDGALWFTGAGSIGRITTAGGVTPFTFFTGTCIGSPDWIAAGPDGALWFTTDLAGAGAIGRITTSGMVTTFTGPSIDAPTGITAGPDGALWFVNSASRANPGTGSIGRITTAGVVGNYAFPGINDLSGITTGPGGTLWFTGSDPQQAESVYKMTTSGAVTEYANPGLGQVGGSYLGNGGGIVQGPDDAMWFADYGGSPSAIIGRLSATTGAFTPYDTPGWAIAANEIASGPGNALWFTMGARGIARLPAPALTPVPS